MDIFGCVWGTQLVESFSALLEWRRSDMMARNGAHFTKSKCHERQAVVEPTAGLRGAMEDLKRHIAPVKDAIEPILERLMTKKSRKRFLERAGPALLVVTFIEDGLRIVLRWSEQMHYMTQVMGMCAPRTIPRARRANAARVARRLSFPPPRRPRRLITQELVPRRPPAHLLGGRAARRGVARDAPRAHQAVARQARLLRAPRLRRAPAVHVRAGARRRLHVPLAHARRRAAAPDLGRERQAAEHRADGHRRDVVGGGEQPGRRPAAGEQCRACTLPAADDETTRRSRRAAPARRSPRRL